MDVLARLPGCEGQAADAVSAHTQVKLRMLQNCSKFQSQSVRTVRSPLPTARWVFRKRIKVATTRCGCISLMPNPRGDRPAQYKHAERLHLKERTSPYDPPGTKRPFAPLVIHVTRTCSHEHRVKGVPTTTCTSRPSFNDWMRNRQPLPLHRGSFVMSLAFTITLHVALHPLKRLKKKEKKITGVAETSRAYSGAVQRHGRTCSKMRRAIL